MKRKRGVRVSTTFLAKALHGGICCMDRKIERVEHRVVELEQRVDRSLRWVEKSLKRIDRVLRKMK